MGGKRSCPGGRPCVTQVDKKGRAGAGEAGNKGGDETKGEPLIED